MLQKIRPWLAAHPNWALTLATVAVFFPFLVKPFNIDEPLFLWAAQQIHAHPLHPYDFNVNWDWTNIPMWKITENPPLACYFIALVAAVLGWSELALHSAFLLPALAVVLGTYRLAKLFCGNPILPALITLFTPVFLVSANTVMCDVLMLAFWIWAIVFWVEGLEQRDFRRLLAAGSLIALGTMTKYYAVCLIPLLAAFSLARRRPLGTWAQFLLIPLAVLCAYQYLTAALYGYSLLYRAMDYASFSKDLFKVSKLNSGLVALAFAGGCSGLIAVIAPMLWGRRGLVVFASGLALIGVALGCDPALLGQYAGLGNNSLAFVKLQTTFWAAGGLGLLALSLADFARRRDAFSLLLFLWMAGTFYFAAFCNWTVNARSLLPMIPAVAILVARLLEQKNLANRKIMVVCVALPAVLGILVMRADFLQASAVRECVLAIRTNVDSIAGNVWFEGHWGFQYYLQEAGATPMDFKHLELKPGQVIALPANNTNIQPLDQNQVVALGTITVPNPAWLATWNPAVGAGFYASAWGPIPFAFGRVPPERVTLYQVKPMALKN